MPHVRLLLGDVHGQQHELPERGPRPRASRGHIAHVAPSANLTSSACTYAHATEELDHALKIANHVDYLGGMPSVTPKPVKTSEKAEDMLKFDLENERVTIANYRRRVRQAEELNEIAIAESLRGILVQEQDHLIALATALGIDPPDAGIAD